MQPILGRILVFLGILLTVLGLILWFAPRVPWLGRLPGDIHIRGERFSFYFPLVTCLVVSILLTILLNWLLRR